MLIILSWLPFAQLLIFIAHNNNQLTDPASAQKFRLAIWGVQIIIGLIGLWFVGEVAVKAAKEEGWKRTPHKIWHLFKSGS